MRHKQKLKAEEKIRIWLDLCDFTFNLMRRALSPGQFARKIKRIREQHWQEDLRMLAALGRIS